MNVLSAKFENVIADLTIKKDIALMGCHKKWT
jgi:hypothetical protein